MIKYAAGLEIPSHLERQYLMLRTRLIERGVIVPYPYIPMLILSFSEEPVFSQKRETLYLRDMLGEGGLIMDSLIEHGGLFYWSSSRMGQINKRYPASEADAPFAPGKGILLGRREKELKREDLILPVVSWKKGVIIYREIDFSPFRLPGERVNWPGAVRWKEYSVPILSDPEERGHP